MQDFGGRRQDADPASREMLERLDGEVLRSFLPTWIDDDADTRDIVREYEAGRCIEAIARDLRLPVDEVTETLGDYVRAQIIECCLRGGVRADFIAMAERFGIDDDTVYFTRHRFACFASSRLQKAEVRGMCTHGDHGGDGQVPLADRRVWAGSQCPACDILSAFDRFGHPVYDDLQLFAQQAGTLKAYGVVLEAA